MTEIYLKLGDAKTKAEHEAGRGMNNLAGGIGASEFERHSEFDGADDHLQKYVYISTAKRRDIRQEEEEDLILL